MVAANDLAEIGALMGDPARANMLFVLFDGGAHSAADLAASAGITPQTASWHLSRLTEGQLLVAERRGRHRFYRLASPRIAQMLEAALLVAGAGKRRPRAPSRADEALRTARTCYDHLAGRLGVGVTDALVKGRRILLTEDGGRVTRAGARFLSDFGVDLGAAERGRRVFCRPCLDWTERRPHLAGAIGAAIAARCLELGWIERRRDSRAVNVTRAGRRGFSEMFGVDL